MRHYYYLAVNDKNEGFICTAFNKKQMKRACMNMKLEWSRYIDYNKVVNYLKSFDIELKHETNVTSFRNY